MPRTTLITHTYITSVQYDGSITITKVKTKVRQLAELMVRNEWNGDNSWKIWFHALPKKTKASVLRHSFQVKREWVDRSGMNKLIISGKLE